MSRAAAAPSSAASSAATAPATTPKSFPWISNSFATGTVSSVVGNNESFAAHAGGLVGANWGGIETSYATGNVSSSGNVRTASVGGLVGQLMGQGTIWSTYASGNVTIANTYAGAAGSSAGGLVGGNQTDTSISDSYALGNVTVSGVTANYTMFAGGLVGTHVGSLWNAYSTGSTSAGAGNAATLVAGGFIGNQIGESNVTNGYWDTGTSNRTNAVGTGSSDGITGLTTAQARSIASYAGFDFSGSEGSWFMIDGQTRPFLRSEWSNVIRNTHQLQLVAMAPGGSYVLANNIDFTGQFNEFGMWGARGFASIGSQSGAFQWDARRRRPHDQQCDHHGIRATEPHRPVRQHRCRWHRPQSDPERLSGLRKYNSLSRGLDPARRHARRIEYRHDQQRNRLEQHG